MEHQLVIEWAPFVLKEGIDETTLLQASEALQSEFLSRQPGFVKRELLRADERHWVDMVYWENSRAIEEAMKSVAESPACYRYFQLMVGADHDNPGSGVSLFQQVKTYHYPSNTKVPA